MTEHYVYCVCDFRNVRTKYRLKVTLARDVNFSLYAARESYNEIL